MASPAQPSLSELIDQTTILSLLSTVAFLGAAYYGSLRLLPANAGAKTRILFIWHAFDALIHTILEGGFLYNCFFSYTTPSLWKGQQLPGVIPGGSTSAYLAPDVYFLGHKDRLYGALYSTNPLGALWRVYAKADARWGGSDLNVISLELLTVGLGAPLAAWVCYCLVKQRADRWFWMIALATGELYGGFMTFAPEWLSGNSNLDTSNWMYLWLYLFFFNMLWVVLPGWIMYEGYQQFNPAAKRGDHKKRK
ncbi:emopamil binding protein [Neohortaea acidophila]|uniref:Emopamil binding protein n=1 Tax=Neohortaea acidophila TaxID=245834 RepID=A0A6A6PP38_9PEZI|nr:emopamil binding protein [Neohortaea acidophila]KAF2481675.1 emopamil binding protein [Neohortaea acidophila]